MKSLGVADQQWLERRVDHYHGCWRRRQLWFIALAAIVISVIFGLLTRSLRWKRVRNITVLYNGVVINDSSIYKSPTGEVLVRLDGIKEERWYIVSPLSQDVGTPDEQQFWFVPGFAFSKDVPTTISLRSVKAEIDPKMIIDDGLIEFTSLGGIRVRVASNL